MKSRSPTPPSLGERELCVRVRVRVCTRESDTERGSERERAREAVRERERERGRERQRERESDGSTAQGPDNYDGLYSCLGGVDRPTRAAAGACLTSLGASTPVRPPTPPHPHPPPPASRASVMLPRYSTDSLPYDRMYHRAYALRYTSVDPSYIYIYI